MNFVVISYDIDITHAKIPLSRRAMFDRLEHTLAFALLTLYS